MTLRDIIIVNDKASLSGGQPKVAIDSAVGLARQGYNVTFFASAGPPDPSLAAAGVKTVCLDQHNLIDDPNPARAMMLGLWNRKVAAALRDLLAGRNPKTTLVHCHGCDKGLSPAVGPVLTGSGLPLVYTLHNYSIACPNGAFYDYQDQAICHKKPGSVACVAKHCDARSRVHKLYRVGRQWVTWGPGGLPRNLKHIIYLTEVERAVLEPYLPDEAVLHCLPNPVFVPEAPRRPAEANQNFLYIGRLSPEKGPLMFAKAAREAGVQAVFVGAGDEEQAVRAANPDAVLTGWLSLDQVQAQLASARALVLPSPCYETFGQTVYEALACGVPAIVGGWSAAREGVTDGENGLIFGAADQLAATLAKATDDALIAELSKNAYARYWADPLTHERYITRLQAVYEQAMMDV